MTIQDRINQAQGLTIRLMKVFDDLVDKSNDCHNASGPGGGQFCGSGGVKGNKYSSSLYTGPRNSTGDPSYLSLADEAIQNGLAGNKIPNDKEAWNYVAGKYPGLGKQPADWDFTWKNQVYKNPKSRNWKV